MKLISKIKFIIVFFLIIFVTVLLANFYLFQRVLRYVIDKLTTDYSLQIVSLAPYETFLTLLNTAFFISIIFLLPFILFFLYYYFSDALYSKERKLLGFIPLTLFLAVLGSFFGLLVAFKIVIPYFVSYEAFTSVSNMWSIRRIVDFLFSLIGGFALLFQIPVIMYALNKVGLVNKKQFKQYRKGVIIALLIIAAVLTPPDIISQLIMVLPTYALYEITLLLLR